MKVIQLPTLILLFTLTFFLPDISASDYTQWGLPEGAKARLGKGSIRKLAYTPDGNQLLVASSIGVWTYDAHTGEALDLLNMHSSSARTVFSPDRQLFASTRGDNEDTVVHLWHLTNRQQVTTLKGHTRYIESLAFSPDGHTLATASADNTGRLWDTSTGQHKATLVGHTHAVTSVAFSPDGRVLATGSCDDTVRLWDTTTGEYKMTLTKHSEGIKTIAFSPDSQTLAIVAYNTPGVQLWDVNTGKQKQTLWTEKNISCVAFSPDSQTLVTGGRTELSLADVDTGEHKTTFTAHLEEVISIVFSPDGKTFASASADELHLWDSVRGAQKGKITGHTQYIRGFALSPDGRTIAIGHWEKIRLWDTVKMVQTAILYEDEWGQQSLAFSPDGSILASEIAPYIRLWDVATGTHRATLKTYTGSGVGGSSIRAIVFSPNGRFLANGHTGEESIWLWHTGFTRKSILTGHSDRISALAFSPDSRTLASGSHDHTIRFWNVETNAHKMTLTGHTHRILSIAFSPDGKTLASASRDGTVRLWNTRSGAQKATLTEYTNSVAFSPDGTTLASVDNDENYTVRLWDVTMGIEKASLIGHTAGVSHVAFSPDGKMLISASYDGTILLWNLTPATDPITQVKAVHQEGIVDPNDLGAAPAMPFPTQTVVLPNYPNPFNPETWIPYQLAKPADVTVRIYSMSDGLVRTLILGYQPAGIYHSRSRAAYWDGKNKIGEPVASGVYFYTLSAGQTTMTRRMVIRK